eukprot:scaffold283409_cov30-Prasinocladus_malaysianus.AAC.1
MTQMTISNKTIKSHNEWKTNYLIRNFPKVALACFGFPQSQKNSLSFALLVAFTSNLNRLLAIGSILEIQLIEYNRVIPWTQKGSRESIWRKYEHLNNLKGGKVHFRSGGFHGPSRTASSAPDCAPAGGPRRRPRGDRWACRALRVILRRGRSTATTRASNV